MRISKKWTAAFACLLVLAASGTPFSAAFASSTAPGTPEPHGSEGSLYIFSQTGTLIDDPDYIFARSEPLYGSGSPQHMMDPILAHSPSVSGSTQTFTYISSATQLRAGGTSAWEAWAPGAHPEGGIITPTLTADHHDSGTAGLDEIFADVGGTYNLGVAFTKNNGVTVDSAIYRTMHILAGNRFTLDSVDLAQGPTYSGGSARPDSSSGMPPASRFEAIQTDDLEQESIGAEHREVPSAQSMPHTEAFGIIVHSAGTVDLGVVKRGDTGTAPTSLSEITVIDDRSDLRGWDLTLAATDFTATNLSAISASALGYSPRAASDLPSGVAAGLAKPVHDDTFHPVASGAPQSTTTAEGARFALGLQFSPPADAAVGRYTSTLTFTLISR